MLELHVEHIRLDFQAARGHEHRLEPIATHAIGLVADRLAGQSAEDRAPPTAQARVDAVTAPDVRLDLAHLSDAAAAGLLADALMRALTLELGL